MKIDVMYDGPNHMQNCSSSAPQQECAEPVVMCVRLRYLVHADDVVNVDAVGCLKMN